MILSKMKGVQKRLNYIVYTNIQLSIMISGSYFFTPFESLETAIHSQNKSFLNPFYTLYLFLLDGTQNTSCGHHLDKSHDPPGEYNLKIHLQMLRGASHGH